MRIVIDYVFSPDRTDKVGEIVVHTEHPPYIHHPYVAGELLDFPAFFALLLTDEKLLNSGGWNDKTSLPDHPEGCTRLHALVLHTQSEAGCPKLKAVMEGINEHQSAQSADAGSSESDKSGTREDSQR